MATATTEDLVVYDQTPSIGMPAPKPWRGSYQMGEEDKVLSVLETWPVVPRLLAALNRSGRSIASMYSGINADTREQFQEMLDKVERNLATPGFSATTREQFFSQKERLETAIANDLCVWITLADDPSRCYVGQSVAAVILNSDGTRGFIWSKFREEISSQSED